MNTFERLNDIEAEFGTLLKEIGSLESSSTNNKVLSKDFRPFQDAQKPIQQTPAQATFQFIKQQKP